jgi:hypothetical protein
MDTGCRERVQSWTRLGLIVLAASTIGVGGFGAEAPSGRHEVLLQRPEATAATNAPPWTASWWRYDEAVPDDMALREDLERAIELRRREHFDRVLDARDPGELIEHATLLEAVFEQRAVSIDTLFIVGDEFFNYAFRPENGWGRGGVDRTAVDYTPRLRRVHLGAKGGPDAFACFSCHSKGGPDGAGTQSQNGFLRGDGVEIGAADQRNAPHLLGLGPVAALAAEMSKDLQNQAAALAEQARTDGRRAGLDLATKGVAFGRLAVTADGTLDTSGVTGVDSDLIVRPFGWKGHQATLRAMIEESLQIHQGLLSSRIQKAVHEGSLDGAPYGTGKTWYDLDDDGVTFEVDSGMLSTMVGYLAQLETPLMRPPRDPGLLDMFAAGRASFDRIGCAECHRPMLELEDTKIDVRAEPGRTPVGPAVVVDVAKDGDEPKIEPRYAGAVTSYFVPLFSDLKRHDMGEGLAAREAQGTIPARHFLTRSLWGLAETAPYLHDGRAPTVHEAILFHGGEATKARNAYLALAAADRGAVRVFLMSLSRQPKIFVP